MAFALFYEPVDAAQIAASIQAASLPSSLKNTGRKYWNNGLKNWETAPVGQSPFEEPGACPLCRTIVMSGPGVTLAEFRQLCYDVADFLGASDPAFQYLRALADDMGGSSGAVEPWP